jgi:hypothetical protein
MMVWSQMKKGSSTESPFLASSARHHPVNPLPVSLFFPARLWLYSILPLATTPLVNAFLSVDLQSLNSFPVKKKKKETGRYREVLEIIQYATFCLCS